MSIIEIIIVTTLSSLLLISTSAAIASNIKYKKNLVRVAQLMLDRSVMAEEIDRLNYIIDNSSDINEGFTNFLSESRDQAFAYISEVQDAIDALKVAMELGHEPSIDEAYIKLISFLPSENQDVVD